MIRADAYSPEVWEAICTPMHEILPAASRRGALFLGSWTAAVDTELLARHHIRAIVECLEAAWSSGSSAMSSSGLDLPDLLNPGVRSGSGSIPSPTSSLSSTSSSFTISLPPPTHRSLARAPSVPHIARIPSGACANGIRPQFARSITGAPANGHIGSNGHTLTNGICNGSANTAGPKYDIVRYKVPIADSKTPGLIAPHLEGAVRFIKERLARGENVLVHCQQGISRSPSIVLAYLMRENTLSYDAALQLLRSRRKCVKPNEGFEKTLRRWK